jgi:hypothetical protein
MLLVESLDRRRFPSSGCLPTASCAGSRRTTEASCKVALVRVAEEYSRGKPGPGRRSIEIEPRSHRETARVASAPTSNLAGAGEVWYNRVTDPCLSRGERSDRSDDRHACTSSVSLVSRLQLRSIARRTVGWGSMATCPPWRMGRKSRPAPPAQTVSVQSGAARSTGDAAGRPLAGR